MRVHAVEIGPYVAGEIPQPVVYRFQTADGSTIDVTGWAVTFSWRERFGPITTVTAGVEDGDAIMVWSELPDSPFPEPGAYSGEFTAVHPSGGPKYTSELLTWHVRSPVGAVPDI